MEIEIRLQDLSLRVVLAMPEPIPFVRYKVETTMIFVELVVMFVLVMARQATGLGSVSSQVFKVSKIILQLSLVAQSSRVPLLVLLVGNDQIVSMLFRPDKIRKVLLM